LNSSDLQIHFIRSASARSTRLS